MGLRPFAGTTATHRDVALCRRRLRPRARPRVQGRVHPACQCTGSGPLLPKRALLAAATAATAVSLEATEFTAVMPASKRTPRKVLFVGLLVYG